MSIDPAFVALLGDPRSAMRPPQDGLVTDAYRRRLDAPMVAAHGPGIQRVETLGGDATGIGVSIRIYTAVERSAGTILFLHGGGFVIGSLETHDAICRSLARDSGARVVAVDYRLAPEAPFPAAHRDCWAALRWCVSAYPSDRIGICGDSAGGHLAVAVAREAVNRGIDIAALGLLYPVADPAMATGSWQRFGDGHVLTRTWMEWAWTVYLAGRDPTDPTFTLSRSDLGRMPPTLLITAQYDPLRDEGEALAAAIHAAGGHATCTRMPGMIHGFASLPMLTPMADSAIGTLAAHVCQHMC